MRVVLQRVKSAKVEIDDKIISQINTGYLLLVAIEKGDSKETARKMAEKILKLRVMADTDNKMNLNIVDTKGEMLVVSQFTLSAEVKKGNRPSFSNTCSPEEAKMLLDFFVKQLKSRGNVVLSGRFGAYMQVSLQNDGPVTIWLDSKYLFFRAS